MSSLNPGRRNALLLIVLLFGQLLLMSGSVRDEAGSTTVLTRVAMQLSAPVVGLSHRIGGGATGMLSGMRELGTAREENQRLRAEVVDLRFELDRYREDALENERLRRLLLMKEHVAPRSVAARVVTANLTDQEHVIVVDRGSAHGVATDQPVIAWGGVVGRVVFVNDGYAKIRLITDPNSGVAGIVQRSRQEGMVLGRGKGVLEMVYVPSFADVALGDRVVTSGIDGVFPRGIGIGEVQASDASGIARAIVVRPEVQFPRLEEVLILTATENSDAPDAGLETEGEP
jgi:rod shape-determining protein MreC